ncbi:SDR family NAD(P)-dependent oxidoreductase [Gilvimarinus sp. F26214L]|uniref:SDR family NAD(P)-dependent oxidoreductase n=1 Tax=Gilvimarinus sp. DZF01 TaxID=3461371 RepID=UPI004045A56E
MSRLGRNSAALDLVRGIDLRGKTAIVTGGTSGLGAETALALAAAGAEVILPARNLEFGSMVADRLIAETGNGKIRTYEMDLADFDSVRRFADNFMSEYPRLDVLVNCAGVMACPESRCLQGFELHFAVNHLGHFLLTACLASALAASPSCRVVSLSSSAHRVAPVDFSDPNFENRGYEKWQAYGQSKTANALFALALNARLRPVGGAAFSVHPGTIMTNLQRHLTRREIEELGWMDGEGRLRRWLKSPAQGAASIVWAATSPALIGHGGAYCEDCRVAEPAADGKADSGVWPHARDPKAAERLWLMSEQMVDQPFVLGPEFHLKAAGAIK